jgi:hypothetical protein
LQLASLGIQNQMADRLLHGVQRLHTHLVIDLLSEMKGGIGGGNTTVDGALK